MPLPWHTQASSTLTSAFLVHSVLGYGYTWIGRAHRNDRIFWAISSIDSLLISIPVPNAAC